jgi:hypothetical protein
MSTLSEVVPPVPPAPTPSASRRSWAELWPRVAVGAGLVGVVLAWLAQPVVGGDTAPLMAGTEILGRCLARGDLFLCAQATPIGPYPLLQYVPDLVADAGAELSEGGRIRVLATLSGAGVAVAVGAGWTALRSVGCAEWRWLFLVAAVCGPALAYGSTTWGEMLATGLVTLVVAAALVPAAPIVVGLAAFGAGLTKETGYPFVIALGLLALVLAHRRTGRSIRLHVVGLAGGVALALALNSAFNLLRFGTPRNAYYLDPALRTATVGRFLELVAGLVVSPNGGILFFWPTACLLVGVVLSVPLALAWRGATTWRAAWPSLVLLAIVGAIVAGLAAWWSPFGWWAWGPRLSLPWVLPIVLLSLGAFGTQATAIVARSLRSPAGLALAVTACVSFAAPHAGLLWAPGTVGDFFFFDQTAVCPGGGPPPTPAYYACLHEEMWLRHPIWLDSLSGLATGAGAATVVAVTLVVVGCLVQLRRELLDVPSRVSA